ncbi:hypothetical protein [Pseudomonas sp. KK4]|uniref:hypothetical protein n=1 Tax=Pseudomonas sp. KK4 TaxID=1855729 RepID=UPI00097C0A4C|nr:hypothetical protein [Pseudomonas sp. KK4]
MTETWYRVDNGILWIANQPIHLPHPVNVALPHDDRLAVLIEPSSNVISNKNILALSRHGTVLWYIQESPHGTQADKPYMSLHCDKNGALIAGNWNGVSYSVDWHNGSVSVVSVDK